MYVTISHKIVILIMDLLYYIVGIYIYVATVRATFPTDNYRVVQ